MAFGWAGSADISSAAKTFTPNMGGQFFAWLLLHGHLQCKTNLLQRRIVEDATCELCAQAEETAEHLLVHCPFAASFWQRLVIQMEPDVAVCNLLHLPKPENLPMAHFDTFSLLSCWHLWKRRNGIVFRQESESDRVL